MVQQSIAENAVDRGVRQREFRRVALNETYRDAALHRALSTVFEDFKSRVGADHLASAGAQRFGEPSGAGRHVEPTAAFGKFRKNSRHSTLFAFVDRLARAGFETVGVELRTLRVLHTRAIFF